MHNCSRHVFGPALLLALLASAPQTGCTTNVATGQRIYNPLSPEQEVALGVQAAPQLSAEYGGAVQNAQLQQYVTNIGKKLASETESNYPSLPWEFTLLDSGVINAFSLPGGKVFVSRGLVEKMANEAQLAGVLGHEIGHVTAQHVARQVGQQQIVGGVASAAGAVVGDGSGALQYAVPALNVGGQLLLLKFSRTDESQADSLGMRYMTKAGYNPTAQLQVMQILKAESGSGQTPAILATHPLPETRIQQVQQQLNTDYKDVINNPNYQFYPDRFQQQCLAILRTLPPPKTTSQTPTKAPPQGQGGQQNMQPQKNARPQKNIGDQPISRPPNQQ
jgi:predicted Zn-dependent protease